MYGHAHTSWTSKSKTVSTLNIVVGIELNSEELVLANPNAEGLQETKELTGLFPLIYINLIVLTAFAYKTSFMMV